ncbi:MAG TPA: hypothetical protein VH518_03710 [Tepidisphaeraceae bacterium]|jgi:uncharacterized membrane protein
MIVFSVCLIVGAYAGNPFGTVIARALVAMAGTLVIGLILGTMAQKMLDENLKAEGEKLKNDSVKAPESGR